MTSACLHVALLSPVGQAGDAFAQALSQRLREPPLALRVRVVPKGAAAEITDEPEPDAVLHLGDDAPTLAGCSAALLVVGHSTPADVEDALRAVLLATKVRWSLVRGLDGAGLECALDAITPWLLQRGRAAVKQGLFSRLQAREAAQPAWSWVCDTCDSPECEHASLHLQRARQDPQPPSAD